MSEHKSRIGIIIATCLGVLLTGGRLVKSCSKGVKGSVKTINTVDDLSHIRVSKGVSSGSKSSEVGTFLSHANNISSFTDEFVLPNSNPTKLEINTVFMTSGLGTLLLNTNNDTLQIDSIHHFMDFKIYVPNIYTIREYFNNKNVLQFTNGLERIRIFKTFPLPPNRKLGEWKENNLGMRYRIRESSYKDEELEYSYHLRTERSLYQIHYSRVVSVKEDIPKYLFRLEAFIQLIAEEEKQT